MTVLSYIYKFREITGVWLEPNLWWLKSLSVVISAIFLWGIFHITAKTNYFALKTEQFLNILGAGDLPRHRAVKGWRQILRRLKSADPQQWKIAILEADHILNEILKMSGYLGSMDDKLALINSAQLANIEQIKAAHKIAAQIGADPSFEILQETAYEVIEIYRQAFVELNLISE